MSNPQQRACTTSTAPSRNGPLGVSSVLRFCCACFLQEEPQSVVPPDTRVTLLCGLVAPDTSRPQARGPFAVTIPPCDRFSSPGGAPHGMTTALKNPPSESRGRVAALDRDRVAEGFEALDQAVLERPLAAALEVVATEILVGGLVPEQVVGDDQDGVADRQGRSLLAAARRQPPILGCEVGGFRAASRLRRFGQGGPQVAVAFAGLAALALASALVVARAQR